MSSLMRKSMLIIGICLTIILYGSYIVTTQEREIVSIVDDLKDAALSLAKKQEDVTAESSKSVVQYVGHYEHPPAVFCDDGERIDIPFRLTSYMTPGPRKCDLCKLRRPVTYNSIKLTYSFLQRERGHHPLQWKMFLTPNDLVSNTFAEGTGMFGFESWMKTEFYSKLFPSIGRVPKDPLVMDVGANVGIHSFFFGALKLRSHAFEPNVFNYNVLSCTLDANPHLQEYLQIHNFGLTDEETDSACMVGPQDNMGGTAVDIKGKCANGVKLRTFDEFWKNNLKREHIYFMKIDIEGFEGKAFLGAHEMLKEKPIPYIFMEATPVALKNNNTPLEEFLDRMWEFGYEVSFTGGCLDFPRGTKLEKGNAAYEKLRHFMNGLCDIYLEHKETVAKFNRGEIDF